MPLNAPYPVIEMCIGGAWLRGDTREAVSNPATGAVVGDYPVADAAQLDEAVNAAHGAMKQWQRLGPGQRARVMIEATRLLKERSEEIARIMTIEQGKTLAESRAEVVRACEIIEWDANEGRRLYGRVIDVEPDARRMVLRAPLGVIAGFSPWNFPLGSPARKIAGALAAGCGIVLKAAEEAPGSAMMLVRAFEDAGAPKGLCNLVFGAPAETSAFLIAHPLVRGITFTGSVPVGKHLAAQCGQVMKPCIMELGGHAPVIVCDDADAARIGRIAAFAKSRNTGQICTSPTRFLVHERQFEAFVDAFAQRARDLRTGDGMDPETEMGPVTTARRLDAIEGLISDAVGRGAQLHAGGGRIDRQGHFLPLSVLSNTAPDSRIMHDEPFGPVAVINPYRDLDEAIAQANALPYGLAAYAFTNNAATAHRLTEGLECGNLGINQFVASTAESPLGGMKDSGYGREGGAEGLLHYTYAKNVSHKFDL